MFSEGTNELNQSAWKWRIFRAQFISFILALIGSLGPIGVMRNSLSEQFANLATGGPVERQWAFFIRYLLFGVYSPIILTSTRLRRRPSNSP